MTGDAGAEDAVQLVVDAIAASKRYRRLDPSLLRRCAAQALAASGGHLGDAIKRTKRQLHQVYGAYVGMPPRYDRLLARLRTAQAAGPEAFTTELRRTMAAHASSRERLPYLDEMYRAIFDRVGGVGRILDIGCGLNPLAAPWMRLASGAEYIAVDIDSDLVAFVGACLELMGLRARPHVADVVSHPPDETADLALALKMVPCLDQQEATAGARLIRSVNAPSVVVSFPVRSLGGRAKGMRTTYATRFEELSRREGWEVEVLPLSGELVYLVRTGAVSQ